mmetsp:Transcript_5057/g.8681  ORF Transcript_5057/g.8681 Transcript_5057/m.8681 type:complete len:264 (+) Transcript_5057:87-878(+)|eukprot:CAMPEP_0196655776 /NCGR_PEP_ID=MMETSP1086-20130531/8192_1 /TAXON_ID=77921 /ORGANISM="Cyanoptyche  gloeocystis , Strain SAG4.97" /LENGTH=263 /DNA_ID=CAMNT_0041988273 /DNA_START=87 /DNA_END=878 /DNA_ORIENTATION=+
MTKEQPNESTPIIVHSNPHYHSGHSGPDHEEKHFGGAKIIRDVVVGMSDGLTVPFALAAGLSALQDSTIIVTAGLAELAAGGISMGLGGYLAGRTEVQHYDAEKEREYFEVQNCPKEEEEEIYEVFEPYGLSREALQPLVDKLKQDPEKWVDFMMKFELGLERPEASRSWESALTIGGSYILGGLIPLLPYVFIQHDTTLALGVSCGVTLLALAVFGFGKAKFTGISRPWLSALETTFTGAVAAAAAFGAAHGANRLTGGHTA